MKYIIAHLCQDQWRFRYCNADNGNSLHPEILDYQNVPSGGEASQTFLDNLKSICHDRLSLSPAEFGTVKIAILASHSYDNAFRQKIARTLVANGLINHRIWDLEMLYANLAVLIDNERTEGRPSALVLNQIGDDVNIALVNSSRDNIVSLNLAGFGFDPRVEHAVNDILNSAQRQLDISVEEECNDLRKEVIEFLQGNTNVKDNWQLHNNVCRSLVNRGTLNERVRDRAIELNNRIDQFVRTELPTLRDCYLVICSKFERAYYASSLASFPSPIFVSEERVEEQALKFLIDNVARISAPTNPVTTYDIFVDVVRGGNSVANQPLTVTIAGQPYLGTPQTNTDGVCKLTVPIGAVCNVEADQNSFISFTASQNQCRYTLDMKETPTGTFSFTIESTVQRKRGFFFRGKPNAIELKVTPQNGILMPCRCALTMTAKQLFTFREQLVVEVIPGGKAGPFSYHIPLPLSNGEVLGKEVHVKIWPLSPDINVSLFSITNPIIRL